IPEACRLVLQAAALGAGGEVFILDMGEPVRIVDLARRLIVLSGRRPDQVPIVFSGPRPGEKLFEQLALAGAEASRPRHPGIWVGRIDAVNWPERHRGLEELEELARAGYDAAVVRQLGALVPEYLAENIAREPIAAPAEQAAATYPREAGGGAQGAGGEGGKG